MVKENVISLEKLIELLAMNPRKRFHIPLNTDLTVWDLNARYEIDPNEFLTKGRATPFAGETVFGKCIMTICNGKKVFG